MTSTELAKILLWCIPIINLIGIFGQVRTNYRLKSTKGMSFLMLWASHIAVLSFVIYCHLLNLPLSLRVLVPVEAFMLSVLVMQEIWYAHSTLFRRKVTVWHSGVLIAGSLAWYFGYFMPLLVGTFLGWLGVLMVAYAQLPQIIQHWRLKSVRGYSKIFLTSSTISATLLIWIACVLSLPLPSLANGIRALAKRLIIWWQVAIYSGRD